MTDLSKMSSEDLIGLARVNFGTPYLKDIEAIDLKSKERGNNGRD